MELNKYTREDIASKRVILRADLDVKVNKEGVVDEYHDLRLERVVPTIHELIGYGAKQIVVLGHLGRPDGKADRAFSLAPVKDRLQYLCASDGLDEPITFIDDVTVDPGAFLDDTLIMLENLRFWQGEKSADVEFARILARWGDVYVNDAFGNSHQADTSMIKLPEIVGRAFSGLELISEVGRLGVFMDSIKPPFVVVLGGAKISTKLPLISSLIPSADYILLGGGLANTVLASRGVEVGKSLIEESMLSEARAIIDDKIIVPDDFLISSGKSVPFDGIKEKDVALDIGRGTIKNFVQLVQEANTILWNGPMGKFEDNGFESGTFEVALSIAQNEPAASLAGGGETLEVIERLGIVDKFDFVSTGGGAMLSFLSGKEMPGLDSVLRV